MKSDDSVATAASAQLGRRNHLALRCGSSRAAAHVSTVSSPTKDGADIISTSECLLVGDEAGHPALAVGEVRLAPGQLGLWVVLRDQAFTEGAHGVPPDGLIFQ